MPKFFQSDKGSEYKNSVINKYLTTNYISQVISSPRNPKINRVMEVIRKEALKNISCFVNKIEDVVSFKNLVLDCFHFHNNNVLTVTGNKTFFFN